jgi:hypothetical protein
MRECGACSVCCITPEIPELEKPAGKTCFHLSGGRCSVYADRPKMCAEYRCAWLMGHGTNTDRPDRSGALVEHRGTRFGIQLVGKELEPGKRATKAINRIASSAQRVCLVISGPDDGTLKEVVGSPQAKRLFRSQHGVRA